MGASLTSAAPTANDLLREARKRYEDQVKAKREKSKERRTANENPKSQYETSTRADLAESSSSQQLQHSGPVPVDKQTDQCDDKQEESHAAGVESMRQRDADVVDEDLASGIRGLQISEWYT